jgi:hypothetical protein
MALWKAGGDTSLITIRQLKRASNSTRNLQSTPFESELDHIQADRE